MNPFQHVQRLGLIVYGIIRLAERFPRSRFVGMDLSEHAVQGARNAQAMLRERLGIPFLGNTEFGATDPADPAFPLIAYGLEVRDFTFGYNDGASALRDFLQRWSVPASPSTMRWATCSSARWKGGTASTRRTKRTGPA